jgi:adenylate cyclase
LPAARYCGSCGASLRAVQGERKHATVMFADIVGSTQLISGLDPEQAMERLQPAVAEMCAAVQRFDGTVIRTLGDGIMAAFGAPRAQEGHALLACEAALAIQAALPGGTSGPAVRIGLHAGDVVSGVLASDPTQEHGAHGLTVHLASRLQGLAQPGAICLTEDCYRLVRPYCDARPLGRRVLKGFPEPVEVYELVGLKPAVASDQFRRANLSSFRGRDYELGLLQRALRSTEVGDTTVVGIAGAPGAGKSRLCFEFAEWCRGRLIPVLEARAHLYGHATPLQPVLEFLRLLFGVSPKDPAVVRRRIARRVSVLAPAFEPDLPLFYEFLGVPDPELPPSRLVPKVRHARLLEMIRHMVRESGAETNVVIIEDLHWLDEASEDFVTTVVDAVHGTRTMLVLNYRPAYAAPWMKRPHFQELALAELNPTQIGALVEELVGDRPELRDIRDRVAERSGGNPFFAEELVRSLVENGVVFGDAGRYSLGMRQGESVLPGTLEAVVGARIDRLGEQEKAVLQIAAIIGKEFPLLVLQQVVGPLDIDADAVLARLCEAQLIQEQASVEHRQLAFQHPLIQEVAYATQLKARRSVLHAAVATAMEAFYQDRLDEFAGLLAHHYEAAGQLPSAAAYAARAAAWVGSTNPAQAIRHWQKVRSLLQNQPRSEANDTLRIMASGQIAWLGWREGMTADQAKPFLDEALAWSRETDNTMIPLLLFVDGRISVTSGGSADAYVGRVKEALSLVKEDRDIGRVATLKASLSQAYGWAGMLEEALAVNTAALEGIPHIDKFDHQFLGYSVEQWAVGLRGRILVRLGRFAEAEQCFDTLLGSEQSRLDPTLQLIPHLGCVDLAWCRADAALAEHHASAVAKLADRQGSPYVRVFAFACAGTAKSISNDFAGAVREFAAGLEFLRSTKAAMEYESEMLASLADCYYRGGELERAAATAQETIELARRRSTRLPECRASITCGAALLARHGPARVDQAEALFRRADALIRQTGVKIYEQLLTQERARLTALVG